MGAPTGPEHAELQIQITMGHGSRRPNGMSIKWCAT